MKVRHYLVAGFITTFSMQSSAECPIGDYKSTIVDEINTVRSKPQVCGGVAYPAVQALTWNKQLANAATIHSVDMAFHNFFDHVGSKGQRIGARTKSAGYLYQGIGENIAAGATSARQASAGWLASAGHCENIMTASFTDIGVSCYYNPSSTYQYYWTLVMGNR